MHEVRPTPGGLLGSLIKKLYTQIPSQAPCSQMTPPPQSCPKISSQDSRGYSLQKKKKDSEMFLENLVSWGVKDLKMTMLEVYQENKPEQKWQDLLWVESFQSTFQSPFLNRTSLLRLAKHLKKPSSIKGKERKKVKSLSHVRFFVTPRTVAY